MSAIVPSVENASFGWRRRDIRTDAYNRRPSRAWRKGWRDAQKKVECPHCHVVGPNTAHLVYPGSFHCWECKGSWFQEDLTVSPALVLNPEAEGAA